MAHEVKQIQPDNLIKINICIEYHLQVSLHICFIHAFVNPLLFLVLKKELRQKAVEMICCQLGKSIRNDGKKKIKSFHLQNSPSRLTLTPLAQIKQVCFTLIDESALNEGKPGALEAEPMRLASNRVTDTKLVFPILNCRYFDRK